MAKVSLFNMYEFIYDGLMRRGRNYLFNRLDREDFLKVKNEAKIKKFAENARLEDIAILMAKINFGFGIIVWDKENEKHKTLQDVLLAYVQTDANDVEKLIIKEKVYGACPIEIMKGLQVISKNSNSYTYSVNRSYLAIKQNALKPRVLENKLEAERNLEWYSKTIQYALDIEPSLEGLGIDLLKFRTLLALQTAPNGMTRISIAKKLNRTNVTGMLNEMHSQNMVQFNGENKSIVTIGVYGIMLLEQIFNKFP